MSDQPRDRLGRPIHDLRISVTDSCNFRCPYCMPAEVFGDDYLFLRKEELLTFEEIARTARIFASVGVVKLRITGGEPLLRPWLPDLVRMLRAIEGIEDIALITNGLLLEKMAEPLRSAGLGRLTVSLDSLRPQTFAKLSGRGHRLEQVLAAIEGAHAAGFGRIKINTVVERGVNDDEVVDFVAHFRGSGDIVRFIEYMDVGTLNGWSRSRVVPSKELVERIEKVYPLEQAEANYAGEVARRYRLRDGSGEIGFISSISEPFCGACSRARLSADGKLYTCLFARAGHDLMTLLRSGATDGEIEQTIRSIWSSRADRYSEERLSALKNQKVEMFRIGG